MVKNQPKLTKTFVELVELLLKFHVKIMSTIRFLKIRATLIGKGFISRTNINYQKIGLYTTLFWL
jgi:hypothetical protein